MTPSCQPVSKWYVYVWARNRVPESAERIGPFVTRYDADRAADTIRKYVPSSYRVEYSQ
jgi:hypothetical protein